jgi:hypothetical protein
VSECIVNGNAPGRQQQLVEAMLSVLACEDDVHLVEVLSGLTMAMSVASLAHRTRAVDRIVPRSGTWCFHPELRQLVGLGLVHGSTLQRRTIVSTVLPGSARLLDEMLSNSVSESSATGSILCWMFLYGSEEQRSELSQQFKVLLDDAGRFKSVAFGDRFKSAGPRFLHYALLFGDDNLRHCLVGELEDELYRSLHNRYVAKKQKDRHANNIPMLSHTLLAAGSTEQQHRIVDVVLSYATAIVGDSTFDHLLWEALAFATEEQSKNIFAQLMPRVSKLVRGDRRHWITLQELHRHGTDADRAAIMNATNSNKALIIATCENCDRHIGFAQVTGDVICKRCSQGSSGRRDKYLAQRHQEMRRLRNCATLWTVMQFAKRHGFEGAVRDVPVDVALERLTSLCSNSQWGARGIVY